MHIYESHGIIKILRKLSIQKLLRITKGNNSNSIDPLIFISSICLVHMNVFAKFDEIPSILLQDIKETKRNRHTFVGLVCRPDGQCENTIPSHKHSLRRV